MREPSPDPGPHALDPPTTKAADPPREEVDLSLIAEEAAETLLPLAEEHGVTIETSGDIAPTIGSHALLLQLMTNLLHNAIVHNLPEHGTVQVNTATGTLSPGLLAGFACRCSFPPGFVTRAARGGRAIGRSILLPWADDSRPVLPGAGDLFSCGELVASRRRSWRP